ncbi:LysR substrate binding domain protein [compost metagenome]
MYEGHPFLTEDNLSIEDIASQPLVFFECGALDWLRVHRIFGNLDRPPNIQFMTDNSETAKKLVIQKAGISFLPSLSVKEETRDGRLAPIWMPETEDISLQTNIVSSHGKHHAILESILELGKDLFS